MKENQKKFMKKINLKKCKKQKEFVKQKNRREFE